MRCRTVAEIVEEANRILFKEQDVLHQKDAEYFFRGESMNFLRKDEGFDKELDSPFTCLLDRSPEWYMNERVLYQEALRLNVASFRDDVTMVERIARMQHYQLPTRFCDMSSNVLCSAMFACGGGEFNVEKRDNEHDGYIRVIKVRRDKMKSFTSDIITAIAHLPLVNADRVKPSEKDGLSYLRYEVTNNRPGFSFDTCSSRGDLTTAKEQLRKEIQQVWAFKPIWNTSRISNQSGAFLAFGCRDNKEPLNPTFSLVDYDNKDAPSCGIAQVAVIQINGAFKKSLREELRYFGMPVEGVYPDLSNVCSEISNRVKERGYVS